MTPERSGRDDLRAGTGCLASMPFELPRYSERRHGMRAEPSMP
jgi:hypothetical protein